MPITCRLSDYSQHQQPQVFSVTHLVGSRGERSSASDKRGNDGSLHFDIRFVVVGFDRGLVLLPWRFQQEQEVKLKATHSSIFQYQLERSPMFPFRCMDVGFSGLKYIWSEQMTFTTGHDV